MAAQNGSPSQSPTKHKIKIYSTNIKENSFDGEFAMIDFQPFNHIFAGIGETLKNLGGLSVGGPQIKFVERANFEHLEKLKYLSLGGSQIEHLPEDVF
jgi:Leucine-rich repeat (LRR) protein